tara:strand:- start:175 stop:639 length:465 start_codon:yes stop_codon:yes gene_type:complete
MKKIRLENTQNNSNKFYEMNEGNGGIFIATWGRIGNSIYPQQKTYQMSEWDDILNKKLKKGYKQMNPTTTQATRKVAAKRPAKKRPAKRAVRKNSLEGKWLDLKYRINDHHSRTGIDSKEDKSWVMGVIEEVRSGINPTKAMYMKANNLWRTYN